MNKWKPEFGEKYYCRLFIYGMNEVVEHIWQDNFMDNMRYKRGVVFRTEEEAKKMKKGDIKGEEKKHYINVKSATLTMMIRQSVKSAKRAIGQ